MACSTSTLPPLLAFDQWPDPSSAVLAGDSDLSDVPELFVRDTLKRLAPRLLAGSDWTRRALQEDAASTRPTKRCRLDIGASPADPVSGLDGCKAVDFAPPVDSIPPTHILSLPLHPDGSSFFIGVEQDGRLLIPVHAVPFALASPRFAALLHSPAASPTTELEASAPSPSKVDVARPLTPPTSPHLAEDQPLPPLDTAAPLTRLPVVTLDVPASPAFSLLHHWVYHANPSALSRALLTGNINSRPLQSVAPNALPPTPELPVEERLADMSEEELDAVLDRVNRLRELVAELEVGDRELWEVMHRVWNAVADELEGNEGDEEGEEEEKEE
ncbi:hypothetical protein JCM6882_004657 [Rhodosporidiobolus microsporus]